MCKCAGVSMDEPDQWKLKLGRLTYNKTLKI